MEARVIEYNKGHVKHERTGWRDQRMSARHREWGFKLPCSDIDFVLVEREFGFPKAVVEYKSEFADPKNYDHDEMKAIEVLCNNSKIPFLGVIYKSDFTNFRVTPLNLMAQFHLESTKQMDELEYVDFLHNLKGKAMPLGVRQWILDQHKQETPEGHFGLPGF